MELDTSGGKRGRRFFRRREESDGPVAGEAPDDTGPAAADAVARSVGTPIPTDEPAEALDEDTDAAETETAEIEGIAADAPVDAAGEEGPEWAVDAVFGAASTVSEDAEDAPPAVGEEPEPTGESAEKAEPTAGQAQEGDAGPLGEPVPDPLGELPPLVLPRVFAVANQKGGVGKTTTAVNLGAALADLGFRVLVVDLDPQGNATTGLGINHRNVEGSIYDVIMNDASIDDCVEPTSLRNLFVVPATIDLAGAEIELVPAFSRELKLKRALNEVRDGYDFVLIDCPPSLGLLTVNGLAAADDVLVPIQCEYYALEGLGQLLRNVDLVSRNLNPGLSVRGIVLTMYDARTKLAGQVEREVRSHFGARVYRTVVPRTVRISEAPSFGQPITLFDPSSRGAIAYRELAKEVSRGASRRTG